MNLMKKSTRSLILYCLAATVGIHGLFFLYFSDRPLLWKQAFVAFFSKPQEKENNSLAVSQTEPLHTKTLPQEELSLIASSESENLSNDSHENLQQIKEATALLFHHNSNNSAISVNETDNTALSPCNDVQEPSSSEENNSSPLKRAEKLFPFTAQPPSPPGSFAFPGDENSSSPLPSINAYHIEELVSSLLDWSSSFTVEAAFVPSIDSKGQQFLITLTPKAEFHPAPISQTVLFLLNCSRWDEKRCFNNVKKAALKAISALPEGAPFNLCLATRSGTLFSTKSLPRSTQSLLLADHFLSAQNRAKAQTPADLFAALPHLVSSARDPNDLTTVVLITDGSAIPSYREQKRTLDFWQKINKQNLSFYAAAVSSDKQLPLLQLLTKSSGGELLFSSTQAAFPRKLAQFVKEVSTPIASNISITLSPENPRSQATLFLSSGQLPALYSGKSLLLSGTLTEDSNLLLTIHGKHGNQPFFIQKTVSFAKNSSLPRSMESAWKKEQACRFYERYLTTGDKNQEKSALQFIKLR